MNKTNTSKFTFRSTSMLLVLACTLTGKSALAEDLVDDSAKPSETNLVLASATRPAVNEQQVARQSDDPAVAEALLNLTTENKLELDMRLSGHKSAVAAADL